ncbi:hypothetical protein GQ55_8G157000 [Panicum hallii var. hallii]|uniref:Uncharacterized protein n=1 Tax=Panicum hallii var. hallii TaxID=1504633 RepID=A0A2T7CN93_9POAL|nr:hypothetical protein GQ55_8G157000 [Panicum hallii var. hallii]
MQRKAREYKILREARIRERSHLSVCILEVEEPDDGGGDTDLEEEPTPLAIEGPVRTGRWKACAKRRKWVRSILPTDVTPGASSMILKRLRIAGAPQQPVHQELPPIAENSSGGDNILWEESLEVVENTSCHEDLNGCSSPLRDWSYPNDELKNLNEISAVPTQRGGLRKARATTRGILLDNMNKAMGRRMPISVAEGNLRPHEPVQAAKFESEAIPILTHWKEYKAESEHFDGFVGRLSWRLEINTRHQPIVDAPRRYKLKQQYFVGVLANEIPATSPISYMTDAQGCKLVDKWLTAHNKVISLGVLSNM